MFILQELRKTMTSAGEVVRTGHSACSVSTLDNLTDEDMTKYTVKVRQLHCY